MKNIKGSLFYIITVAFLCFFSSCSKDRQILVSTLWEAESMKVHADSNLIYSSGRSGWWKDTPVTLSFLKQNKYLLHLEANVIEGKVVIANNSINFKEGSSTMVCCDSPFAESCFYLMEEKINHYSINNEKLILMGEDGEAITFFKQY